MIKTIVKRNGQKEAFSNEKANGWGEWAAKTLGSTVDWGSAVLYAATSLGEECTSTQFQNALIEYCLNQNTDEHSRMAGRLYAAIMSKDMYGNKKPTILGLHERLFHDGLMVELDFSEEEYEYIEKNIIKHVRDLKLRHYQLHQIRRKYALRNKVTGKEYETPQFVYMRMAMALSEKMSTGKERLEHVKNFYNFFSLSKLNPPTPNFTNLGTKLNGYVSCCLYESGDSWKSLAAGDHIAYAMTCLSAGIGSKLNTRSIGDPVRNGLFPHQGKVPYYRAMVGMVGANLQNGRGGACTTHYTCFDPEVKTIMKLRNPLTPSSKQVKGIDYSFGSNKTFARLVAQNKPYATFSMQAQPELYRLMYEDDATFSKKYEEYLQTVSPEDLIPSREILVEAVSQAYETGRHYMHNVDEINRHTPFKDPIRLSNLCQEVLESCKPYESVEQLYQEWDESHGEIALCNLAGIIKPNITSDEEYSLVAEYALRMIDACIEKTDYPFKSLEYTAKQRMNAGVGVLGLAHDMAKNKKKYSTLDGRNYIHEVFETHFWHLVHASLKLSKERGLAGWMKKTKWPDGWLPIDTYNRNVDKLVTVQNKRDWESLRAKIIENGGIGHTVLVAHMPGESCLSGDTEVVLADDSTMTLMDFLIATGVDVDDLLSSYNSVEGGKWLPLPAPIMVKTRSGPRPVSMVWYNGYTNYATIELEDGRTIKATYHHKFLVADADGNQSWKMVTQLKEGDEIVEL